MAEPVLTGKKRRREREYTIHGGVAAGAAVVASANYQDEEHGGVGSRSDLPPPSILSMFLVLKSAGALLLGIGFTRRWS